MLLFACPALSESIHDSLVIGIQSTKTILIRPFEPQERDILSAYSAVYESLVTIDDNYFPQPCLAESWEESSAGKYWTFHLRQDVRFSDGTPLTAKDVVASANYILSKAQDESISDHGFYAILNYFVSTITAKDDYTVSVRAKRPYFGILYQMTFPVVPEAYVNADSPPGTGPYMITEFHAGDRMWLAANPYWWQTQPQVQEILFTFKDTARSVVEDYEFDRVKAVFTRSVAGAQYKTGTKSITMSYRTNQLECLLMNNTSRELTLEVRKAIRCLIDKNKIISDAYSGLATASNFPFYPGTWMYNDALDSSITHDVEEAKRLLAEAGWEDADENGVLDRTNAKGEQENLHLRFFYYEEPDNDVRAETANIIVDALSEVGIECELKAMTMGDVQTRVSKGGFDLALVSYAMDKTPDPGFMLLKGNSGNYVRYKSDRMDELCNALRKEVTQEGYRQKLMEIQSLFLEDCPFICLFWRMGNVLTRYMYTACRDVREYELLRGIESFVTR